MKAIFNANKPSIPLSRSKFAILLLEEEKIHDLCNRRSVVSVGISRFANIPSPPMGDGLISHRSVKNQPRDSFTKSKISLRSVSCVLAILDFSLLPPFTTSPKLSFSQYYLSLRDLLYSGKKTCSRSTHRLVIIKNGNRREGYAVPGRCFPYFEM